MVTLIRRMGLGYFMPEVVGGRGSALLNALHCIVLFASVAVVVIHRSMCFEHLADDSDSWQYRTVKRVHLLLTILRSIMAMKEVERLSRRFRKQVQRAVSMNKRRFVDADAKLDLDLTFICDRLIVMAIPCVDGAPYRNDIREDFESNGNGCYDCMMLYNQVQKLPFRDHNVPTLSVLLSYCKQAAAWLAHHPENVVAIHCQGGKGRSGTFCTSLMLWTGFSRSAEDAMHHFAHRRTDLRIDSRSLQGVDAPCQKRYIRYMESLIADGRDLPPPERRLIVAITVGTAPLWRRAAAEGLYVSFIVESMGTIQYDHAKRHGLALLRRARGDDPAAAKYTFDVNDVLVAGDVTVRFYVFDQPAAVSPGAHGDVGRGGRSIKYGPAVGREIFYWSWHTAFHQGDNLTLMKAGIDGAYDKSDSDFLPSFTVSVDFRSFTLPVSQSTIGEPPSPGRTTVPMLVDSNTAGPNSAALDNNEKESGLHQRRWERLPCGMLPGPRFVRLTAAAADLFALACPEPLTFHRGEIIYDPAEDDDGSGTGVRSLYFIVAGAAEYALAPAQLGAPPQGLEYEINRGDSVSGLQIAAGSFFGELKFLLGRNGDPSSFVLRAATDVVQVRVLRTSDEGNGGAIIGAGRGVYSAGQLGVLFEALAKAVSLTARDIANHISRLTIKHTSVKREANVGSREAQLVKRAMKELHVSGANQYLRSVRACLFSTKERENTGHLLVFSGLLVFYAARRFGRSRKHLKVYYRDIHRVSALGEKLKVFIALEADRKLGHQPGRRSQLSESILLPARGGTGGNGGMDLGRGWKLSKHRSFVEEQLMDEIIATSDGKERELCLHFDLSDEETCNGVAKLISHRLAEARMAHLNMQKEAYRTLPAVQRRAGSTSSIGEELSFGYTLPDEALGPADRDALGFILGAGQRVSFAAGEVILHRGSIERRLYHITTGSTACLNAQGQVLVRLGAGEIFGEISFLDTGDGGAGSNVIAEEATECLVLDPTAIEMVASLHPLVALRFWRSLAVAAAFRLRQQLHAVEMRRRRL